MSAFKDGNFIKEFACRTQLNYFRLKFNQESNLRKKNKIQLEIHLLEEKMKNQNYDVSNYYEITQLINSLIGLLVFPQQGYYKALKYRETECRHEMPTLYNYIKNNPNGNSYISTYNEDEPNLILTNALRHMRNAASHNKMGIFPDSANGKDITHITFKDNKGKNETFKLTVKVDDLEKILIEISNYIIDLPL